jgi:hypothetical protein
MDTLEVRNQLLFVRDFHRIPEHVRTVPSKIMILVTSKCVIGFVVNLFIFMVVLISGWEFADVNKFHNTASARDVTEISLKSNLETNVHIIRAIGERSS